MKWGIIRVLVAANLVAAGCADMNSLGGPKYGETSGTVITETDRLGTVSSVETIQVDDEYKLGIGTAVGAVAGGLLGSQIGSGRGATTATIVGAAVGAAAGTVAESKLSKKDAQRVTVRMRTGGDVTIVQPVDTRLRNGLNVRVEGSGESARVVPR